MIAQCGSLGETGSHERLTSSSSSWCSPAAASRYSQHSIQAPHSGAKNWSNRGKEPHQCGGCGVVGSVAVVWSQWWLIHQIHGHALPRIQKSSTHWGEIINLEWDAKSIRIIHIGHLMDLHSSVEIVHFHNLICMRIIQVDLLLWNMAVVMFSCWHLPRHDEVIQSTKYLAK